MTTRNDDIAKSGLLVRPFRQRWLIPNTFVLVLSAIIGGGCAITPQIGLFSETKAFDFADYPNNGVAATGRYGEWAWLADETKSTDALVLADVWANSAFVAGSSSSDELHATSSSVSLRDAPRVVSSASPHQSFAWEERFDLVIGRVSDLGNLSLPIRADDRPFALAIAGNQSSRRVAKRLPNGILALSSVVPANGNGP